jgi:hypothetical protein
MGDWLAGTLVVQAERPVGEGQVQVSLRSQALARDLMAQGKMANLLPDDFAALREYLQRRTVLTKQARQDLSVQLARQLRRIIELETLPQENMPAERFLEALYWAYQKQLGDRRRLRS